MASKVLVVVADDLTLSDITGAGPNLSRLLAEGEYALMSPGLPVGSEPVLNVYATLGAGDSVQVGDISQGRLARTLAAAGLRSIVIGDAAGDDIGPDHTAAILLPGAACRPAEAPDALSCGGRRVDPALFSEAVTSAVRTNDLVVAHFGDLARIQSEQDAGYLAPAVYKRQRAAALAALDRSIGLIRNGTANERPSPILYIVVPCGPPGETGNWDRLPPILRLAPGARGGALTSATTHTLGLVAARDFAPTVLRDLDLPVPIQMTGACVVVDASDQGTAVSALGPLDRITWLNQRAQLPFFWGLGFAGGACLLSISALLLLGRIRARSRGQAVALYVFRLLASWPLALLLAPCLEVHGVAAYIGVIAALTAALALVPSADLIFALTALVLLADAVTGTSLVSHSLLSTYAMAGIRFYGIGNEYMGVLLAGALLAAAAFRDSRFFAVVTAGLPVFWFALVLLILAFPGSGAKAGGAVTGAATFLVCARSLRGLPAGLRWAAAGAAAGFVLVIVLAGISASMSLAPTHIDLAASALFHGRFGFIAGVALRKVEMAFRIIRHPGTLLGLCALTAAMIAGRFLLGRPVAAYLSGRPGLNAAWKAALWGSLVAVLFNDSGIVAAILLMCCLLVALLYGLARDCPEEVKCGSWPWTWAMSASDMRSATP